MSLLKSLKIWAISISIILCPLHLAADTPDVEIINDRFLKMDGKIYGYMSEDKLRSLKTKAEKFENKKKEVELLKKKVRLKDLVIEDKSEIIADHRDQIDVLHKTVDRSFKIDSKSILDRIGESTAFKVLTHSAMLGIGLKLGLEASE